jgi:Zn-dependent protease with chaperone function
MRFMCVNVLKVFLLVGSEHKRVDRVAKRVVAVARSHIHRQVDKYRKIAESRVLNPSDELKITNEKNEVVEIKSLTEELEKWENALHKFEGDWKVVLIRDSSPNAFVTELCPKRIFVNKGLLDALDPSDDELGMILSHEVSHIILGHYASTNETLLFSLLVQLIFISFVDPFGVLSLFLDYFSFELTQLYTAYHSRSMESEAVHLGIYLSAWAFFDVEKGAHVFRKLDEMAPNDLPSNSWYQSHPSSKARFEALTVASKQFTALHDSSECQKWRHDFDHAVEALHMSPLQSFARTFWARHVATSSSSAASLTVDAVSHPEQSPPRGT